MLSRLLGAEPPFPATVKVGCRTYQVVELSQDDADDQNVLGRHSGNTRRVYVSRHRGPAETAYVLLHELHHAVLKAAAFDDVVAPAEEYIVAASANGLTQAMQDNPELRAWLAWAWAQGA